jgi:hypothetical protein
MKTKSKSAPAAVEIPTTQAPAVVVETTVAAPAKAKKPKATPSAMVANIRTACEALMQIPALASLLQYRQFNTAGSFVVRLPNFRDAVDVLPQSADAKSALALIKNTRSEVESLTGTSKQTWVFHTSGSFALYSKLNG